MNNLARFRSHLSEQTGKSWGGGLNNLSGEGEREWECGGKRESELHNSPPQAKIFAKFNLHKPNFTDIVNRLQKNALNMLRGLPQRMSAPKGGG